MLLHKTLPTHLQALRKKVGLLETALQDKERELESLQQVAPGSLREAQLLRRQIMQHEENLAQKELRCMQLEEVRVARCNDDIMVM